MAISFAESALAQEKDTAGPQTVQQRDLIGIPDTVAKFDELHHKLEEAYNKNDAAAVVALFTEDAVLVAADGIFGGRQHITERYADAFQRSPIRGYGREAAIRCNRRLLSKPRTSLDVSLQHQFSRPIFALFTVCS